MTKPISHIIILGGGTAGWMTAAAFSQFLIPLGYKVTLIESDAIGTVGVGEATLPHLRFFNQTLGIDENEFMRTTHATYKIGIEFSNWGKQGDAYIHPFGDYGQALDGVEFHQLWARLKAGPGVRPLDDFCLAVSAAKAGKFTFPGTDERSILSTYSYAFHLDAGLYATYLRRYCESRGIVRIEGKVDRIEQGSDANINTLILADGSRHSADLFIDCSGFRSLLLGDKCATPFEDWSHWLACDRALAVGCEHSGSPLPYTKAIAREAGWQWRIPLQHRLGNGYVYCSQFISDDEAQHTLLSNLTGTALGEPKLLQFKAGRREKSWANNCIAIGLASGFLEPLESTSIYLIQIAIMKLIALIPRDTNCKAARDEFNRQMTLEYDRIRDFLILHYHATQRDDTAFWRRCRDMEVPEDLKIKMALFQQDGHIVSYKNGLFLEPSWLAVYAGQHIAQKNYNPLADNIAEEQLIALMESYALLVQKAVAAMPSHSETIARQCSLKAVTAPQAALSLYRGQNGVPL
ncbi:tryptophan 7-halogenase [Simiduia curdlanivorans]|uniref:Tryptophan halogenase family protein n=1 Tax=Simiduia curdlanivorans TaxID=1492769 RepID=A0ABV8V079_9GAMM|nr:tryptophan halogenase family protein [Simiduia curdlanivorans]MDN3637875.1 tryptophan 7-halogenase [Simiduia curdlanivorans]